MKITKVEPLLVDRFCYVRIETDQGITGIGESGAWGQLEATAASIAKYAEYLVPRVIHTAGYSRLSLTRASALVNCQSVLTCFLLRLASQAATSCSRVNLFGMRRSRH